MPPEVIWRLLHYDTIDKNKGIVNNKQLKIKGFSFSNVRVGCGMINSTYMRFPQQKGEKHFLNWQLSLLHCSHLAEYTLCWIHVICNKYKNKWGCGGGRKHLQQNRIVNPSKLYLACHRNEWECLHWIKFWDYHSNLHNAEENLFQQISRNLKVTFPKNYILKSEIKFSNE